MQDSNRSSSLVLWTWLLIIYHYLVCVFGARSSNSGNDISLNQYTDSGEVAQVLYASESVKRMGPPLLGFSIRGGGAIVALRRRHSSNLLVPSVGRLFEIYGDTLVTCTGRKPDCDDFRRFCNLKRNSHMLSFGEDPPVDLFARSTAKWILRGMYRGLDSSGNDKSDQAARPLAVAAIMLSGPRLVVVECSGAIRDCSFACLGEKNLPGGSTTLRRLREKLKELNKSPMHNRKAAELSATMEGTGGDNVHGNDSDNGDVTFVKKDRYDFSSSSSSSTSTSTSAPLDIWAFLAEIIEEILTFGGSDEANDGDGDGYGSSVIRRVDDLGDEDSPLPFIIDCAVSTDIDIDTDADTRSNTKREVDQCLDMLTAEDVSRSNRFHVFSISTIRDLQILKQKCKLSSRSR
jgi:20S proteasome alpha/beta subunit